MTNAAIHTKALRVARRVVPTLADAAGTKVRGALARFEHRLVWAKGRPYEYDYMAWQWNLHDHGVRKRARRWVFVGWHKGRASVWVVPGKAVKGMTVHLLAERQRRGRALLDRYRVCP